MNRNALRTAVRRRAQRAKAVKLRAVACVLLLMALPGAAFAQSYETALLDGVSARDRAIETGSASDWQRAAQHFARARELRSTKEAEFEFAEAALRLDRWLEAYGGYEAALELGLEGKAAQRARAFLAARASEVARLMVEGPAGARIHVDEGAATELPLRRPLVVRPGSVELRAERDGFHGRRWRLDVAANSSTTVQVQLEPLPVPSPPPPAPPRPEQPASEPPGWAMPLTLAGGSLFLAGGVGALTTSLLLPGERRELDRVCAEFDGDDCASAVADRQEQAQSVANRIETFENLRWVAFSAAGVGLLGAVVGLVPLLLDGASTETAQQTSLRAAPDGLLLEWRGRF